MKKVVIATAGEPAGILPALRSLRSKLAGRTSLPEDPEESGGSKWNRESLIEAAKTADEIVIVYSSETAESAANSTAAKAIIVHANLPILAPDEVSALPGHSTIRVAIAKASDRQALPRGLQSYRCYDLSDENAEAALLCALCHEPISIPVSRPRQEAAIALSKILLGHVATVLGNQDRVQDTVNSVLGQKTATIVHVFMTVLVLLLLASGYVVILQIVGASLSGLASRLGLGPLLRGLDALSRRLAAKMPARWAHLRIPAIAGTVILLACFTWWLLPPAPNIDETVLKQRNHWADRIVGSQLQSGAFREHPNQGKGQVWTTAQCVVGLLSTLEFRTNFPIGFAETFAFIDDSKIANVRIRPEGIPDIARLLTPIHTNGLTLSSLPTSFASIPAAKSALARYAGLSDLPLVISKQIGRSREQLFLIDYGTREGWGYYEQFRQGITEATAWVALAISQAIRHHTRLGQTDTETALLRSRLRDAVGILEKRELRGSNGECRGYSPISDITNDNLARTYSALMSLWAMSEAIQTSAQVFTDAERLELEHRIRRGIEYLARVADRKGWRVNFHNASAEAPFLGLTTQALAVLQHLTSAHRVDQATRGRILEVKTNLLATSSTWMSRPVTFNERMHDVDCHLDPHEFIMEQSSFLWYPWCIAFLRTCQNDSELTERQRETARTLLERLRSRVREFGNYVESDYNYVAAEGLVGFGFKF